MSNQRCPVRREEDLRDRCIYEEGHSPLCEFLPVERQDNAVVLRRMWPDDPNLPENRPTQAGRA